MREQYGVVKTRNGYFLSDAMGIEVFCTSFEEGFNKIEEESAKRPILIRYCADPEVYKILKKLSIETERSINSILDEAVIEIVKRKGARVSA